MSKRFLILGMGLMCLLGTVQAFGQAANRSYYVRADGNDANNGRSEEAPLKTLKKAIEMAVAGAVKTITVIGTVGGCEISNAGTQEILITGKPDASETEKALISSEIQISGSKFRFTHVQITNKRGNGLRITNQAIVTLGMGARITNCSLANTLPYFAGAGVNMENSTLNMTDNAVISDNTAEIHDGGGVKMRNNCTLNMSGNAAISGNSAVGDGGGVSGGQTNMSENATISGNTAKKDGGGVDGNVTLSGNAAISGNSAGAGGGVNGSVTLSGNAAISGNTAEKGGGVHGSITMNGGKISGNTAKQGGGLYSSPAIVTLVMAARITNSDSRRNSSKMENGEISGNKAEYGAGCYVENDTLTVAGGKITANEAEFVGGGVYVKTGATYEPGKDASVTGNTAGDGEGEDVFRQ
jgi:hypothetical protein